MGVSLVLVGIYPCWRGLHPYSNKQGFITVIRGHIVHQYGFKGKPKEATHLGALIPIAGRHWLGFLGPPAGEGGRRGDLEKISTTRSGAGGRVVIEAAELRKKDKDSSPFSLSVLPPN